MSLTSTVTPYSGSSSSGVADLISACVVGTVAGTVAVARWLGEETEADRAAVDALRTAQRTDRVAGSHRVAPAGLTAARLHLRDPETLVRTAERLGYRVERAAATGDRAGIGLVGQRGERLAIARDRDGGLALVTRDAQRIQRLVRQHSPDRAVEHLRDRGLDVQTAALANGETQIRAREQTPARRGGAADVKAQVRTDGTVHVDVDCVRGSRCETLAGDLADAVGGRVARTDRKAEYFQLPGEPTRTHRRV